MCNWLILTTGVKLAASVAATILVFGVPILCSYFLVERPIRFGASVGAFWLCAFMVFVVKEWKKPEELRPYHTRSFFGAMKIEPFQDYVDIDKKTREYTPAFTHLVHGTTVHGMQLRDPDELSTAAALQLLGANGPADALALAWIADPHFGFPVASR